MEVPKFRGVPCWDQYRHVFDAAVRSNGWVDTGGDPFSMLGERPGGHAGGPGSGFGLLEFNVSLSQ